MANFVLVHGAWGGSASYNAVARVLRAKGHDVFAPSLTGLGDRSHLLSPGIDLSLHIKDVTTVFDYERLSDVILVGHSYGGMVITGVAPLRADRIRALVYVDAFLPDDGQALIDLPPEDPGEFFVSLQRDTPGLVPPYFVQGPGADLELAKWVSPHPLLTFTEPVKLSGAEKKIKHRSYIVATGGVGPGFRHYYDKLKVLNDPSWKLVEMPTGHNIQTDDPDGLAALLLAELDR